ncbi:MAG: hypothetical protein AAB685_02065, partial [Patescibacteria group bacterium]
ECLKKVEIAGRKKVAGLNGLISAWKYRGVIRKAIIATKYNFAFDVANELAVYFSRQLRIWEASFKNSVLVPIPLHPSRKRYRGFNQSEVLGKIIAKDMDWEYCPDLLVRRIATLPQVGLDSQKRKINLKGAFEINKNYSLMPSLPAQAGAYCLVLFDDVWTTGSTIKEAAQVLRKSGFKNIWGMTLAR